MSELLDGYTALCDAPGGVDTHYLFSIADCSTGVKNIATFTHADGEVTALTLITGKQAFAFNVEQETTSVTDNAIGERTNKSYAREQSMTSILHGNTKEMITTILSMNRGRVVAIVKLNDESYELYFYEKGAKVMDERATGTAFEDLNGTTLTLTGKQVGRGLKIPLAIVQTLLVPAV
jgi:hypothetical protein